MSKFFFPLVYSCSCLCVHLFVCPSLNLLTTSTSIDRFFQQWYLWVPHILGKVLTPLFEQIYALEQKFYQISFFPLVYSCSCLYVHLFVCPSVRSLTTSTFIDRFVQQWYLWISHTLGKVLRPFPNKSMQ